MGRLQGDPRRGPRRAAGGGCKDSRIGPRRWFAHAAQSSHHRRDPCAGGDAMIGPYGEPNEAQQRVPFDAIQSRKRMVLVTRARSVLDMCKNVLEIDEDGIVHDPDADRIAAFAAEVAEEAHGPGSAI